MKTSFLFSIATWFFATSDAFHVSPKYVNPACFSSRTISKQKYMARPHLTFTVAMAPSDETSDSGVMELVDDEEDTSVKTEKSSTAAPFLSQGEISDEALNPDLSDPKQARVIIYIILSLIPVLFLVPLMLGSRDLIPIDALPPVEI